MKIDTDDIERALKHIQLHNKGTQVDVQLSERKMYITLFDKFDSESTIVIFEDGVMRAKVRRTDLLD